MPLLRQATRSPPHEREALLCQAEGPEVAALTTAAIEHIARAEATNTTGWRQPFTTLVAGAISRRGRKEL
eukprot:8011196-Pyramimonas_sp.AAC.1